MNKSFFAAMTAGFVGAAVFSHGAPAIAQTLATSNRAAYQDFRVSQYSNIYGDSIWGTESIDELSSFPTPSMSRDAPHGPIYSTPLLFPASAYQADCDTSVFMVKDPGGQQIYTDSAGRPYGPTAPPVQKHVCRAVAVPVVDMNFIAKITAAGLAYKIVYPIKDNGTGRAYIVWNSDPSWQAHAANGSYSGEGSTVPQYVGYARIEGAGWQNQFASYSVPATRRMFSTAYDPGVDFPHGDAAGDFIASLPSPLRETTLRLSIPMYQANIEFVGPGWDVSMVTDDWLGETPPPLPPAPTVANGPPPPPLNVGRSGNGYAQGQNGRIADGVQKDAGFDFASFCNAPANNGKPRSAAFIEACLAKGQ